jgi:hypothetical protein
VQHQMTLPSWRAPVAVATVSDAIAGNIVRGVTFVVLAKRKKCTGSLGSSGPHEGDCPGLLFESSRSCPAAVILVFDSKRMVQIAVG